MKLKFLIPALGLLLLPGCTTLQNLANTYGTITGASVPYSSVVIAVNAYVAAEKTATNYIKYCTPAPEPIGCNDGVIRQNIDPAIQSGRIAVKSLLAFYQANPGKLGPSGLYNAVVTATQTLVAIESTLKGA